MSSQPAYYPIGGTVVVGYVADVMIVLFRKG
jgi:hypothetical protein